MSPEVSPDLKSIGVVLVSTGEVYLRSEGGVRQVSSGDPVYQGEELVTGADGSIEVRFADDSLLSQGGDSIISLDDFVYSETDSFSSELFFKMGHGTFRMVTGKIAETNPERFKLGSPLATMGIRGTITVHEIVPGGGEKHGVEEIHSGKALLVQSVDGSISMISSPRALVDIASSGMMSSVRPMTMQELSSFQEIAPSAIRQEQEIREERERQGEQEGGDDSGESQAGDEQQDDGDSETIESEDGEPVVDGSGEAQVGDVVGGGDIEPVAFVDDGSGFGLLPNAEEGSVEDLANQIFQSLAEDDIAQVESLLDKLEETGGAQDSDNSEGSGDENNDDPGDEYILELVENVVLTPVVVVDDGGEDLASPVGDELPDEGDSSESSSLISVEGSSGSDFLEGSGAEEVLAGYSGNDVIDGKGGDDTLLGGSGNDTLIGGSGVDLIKGEDGYDFVSYADFSTPVSVDLHESTASAGGDQDVLETIEGIIGGSGDDSLTGESDGTYISTVLGGDGGDFLETDGIYGGYLSGQDGNDTLWGWVGDDTLVGGSGDDTLEGWDGADTLEGGSGQDMFLFEEAEGLVEEKVLDFVSADDWFNFYETNFDQASGFAEISTGYSGSGESLGDGPVFVFDGDDKLWYDENGDGSGDHYLITTVAGDSVVAADLFVAGVQIAGAGITSTGGDGGESIQGTSANDQLVGGSGDDTIVGLSGNDDLNGGAGNDTVSGGDGNDSIWGESGTDYLNGDAGNDRIYGGDDGDTLSGGAGNDKIYGGTGDDVLEGGDGSDIIDGGDGFDYASYASYSATVEVDLSGLTADAGEAVDVLSSIEGVIGGSGDDSFVGSDSIDNVFRPGEGDDSISGGDSVDELDYSQRSEWVRVDIASGKATIGAGGEVDTYEGIENVVGTALADVLGGDAGVNSLRGESGDDTLYGAGGADTLSGGTGADVFDYRDASESVSSIDSVIDFNSGEGDFFRFDSQQGFAVGSQYDSVIGGYGDTLSGGETGSYFIWDSTNSLLIYDPDVQTSGGEAVIAHVSGDAVGLDDIELVLGDGAENP